VANIETGVDKLVKLVAKEKKIELGDAAKQLGVSPTVVQEWAEFLDDEGLVGTQYSLSKTFLVEKRLSKVEVEKKGKEYDSKREAFTRRVDATLKQLENETVDFETIKKQYYSLQDQIGDQIDAIKEDIEQLRHYEELKKSIDQDILKQKVDYQKTLEDIHQRIISEEKRFTKILEDIAEEKSKLQAERGEFADIKREEDDLVKRIEALQDIMKSITGRIASQTQEMSTHEERLLRLRELADRLQKELTEKKAKEIDPLLKISKDQEQRIMRIQDDIVNKVKQRRDHMQSFKGESEVIAKRFESFFDRRTKTEETLKQLETSKQEMRNELSELIKKAKAFDIAAKGSDTTAHIKQLEEKFKNFDQKRTGFAKQLESLKSMILGKEDSKPELKVTAPAEKPQKPSKKPIVRKK